MKYNNNIIDINQDPFDLFSKWFSLAKKNEINDPNAMSLSTVNNRLQPTSRLVLMKFFDKKIKILFLDVLLVQKKMLLGDYTYKHNIHKKNMFRF